MQEEDFWRQLRGAHPRLWEALVADAEIALRMRGEGGRLESRTQALREIVRLACVSDGFLGQALYRVKARLQALGVPFLPRIAHRLAMIVAQVAIGDPVVIAPGVYIAHGQVVIDGITEIGSGVVIAPFVSIGLKQGSMKGPTIERGAHIGTGSRLLGPLHIGEGASIGANSVVTHDVPPGATVTGVPARPR